MTRQNYQPSDVEGLQMIILSWKTWLQRIGELIYKKITSIIAELLSLKSGYMSLSLRTSNSLEKAKKRKFMPKNGKFLLQKLIASCNGKYYPIRNFIALELEGATNNYDPGKVITRGCCLETEVPILVFEFVACGTLADRIHDPNGSQLEPFLMKHRLKVAMEIANAVAYLHVGFSRPIVFRDIKPSTVLFQLLNFSIFLYLYLSQKELLKKSIESNC
ncbi:hypothetical protein WN944_018536 [Citrus x changshan-huyou]|uniref:Protein kinase domain-containing protein n=1 Tax=Citrus x changshan-huyou TaxID=2935761 RepID=A0AAP0QEA2_9ROSI